MKKRYLLLFFIVVFGTVFWILLDKASEKTIEVPIADNVNLNPQPAAIEYKDIVRLEQPLTGTKVTSPFTVKGSARGGWYFEASFPVVLTDINDNVLAVGNATAQGDWMTQNYVPFTAQLTYPAQPSGSSGYLVLKKSNPSGEVVNDDELKIGIMF